MKTPPPGYYFYPPTAHLALGHPQVDIYIASQPIERFFDTNRAVFPIAGGSGMHDLVVTHPWEKWEGANQQRILAGRFQLFEPDGDVHHGFSMGGSLKITVQDELTLCRLTSPAPIFNLQDDPDSPSFLLANELEALVACRQADWGDDEAGFAVRLASVDPLKLFVAALSSIEHEASVLPVAVRSSLRRQALYHAVQEVIQALQDSDRWPVEIPALEDIL